MYKKLNKNYPSPSSILSQLGIEHKKINASGYYVLRCPFHDDSKPSLNLHSVDGHYKCHSCGAKGGSIIDFYMRYKGLSYKEACKELKIWGSL